MSSSWHRIMPLPAAPLVARRRYLIEVPMPLPSAPLVVRRRYMIVALWRLPCCASREIIRGALANARGATQVLDRGAQAVAPKAAPCASQVLDRGVEAVARCAVRGASHVLGYGAQAGAKAVACRDVV